MSGNNDSKEEKEFCGIWIIITIIGLILIFTGAGAAIGIPMLGISIIRLGRGARVFGCLPIIIIVVIGLFIATAALNTV
jgi:hypothetical protein